MLSIATSRKLGSLKSSAATQPAGVPGRKQYEGEHRSGQKLPPARAADCKAPGLAG